ncbi:hypothetical protein R1flu_019410 [Riccia fluitans]|uniref:Uncharacterized protein n=1 Tax=Riccia fluitans TaxID=41844 RepID=A0ABD1ZIX7_9MARC
MAYILPVGLGLVAAVFFVIVSAEVFYLFYWRKRRALRPRLNSVTVAPVNDNEKVEVRNPSRSSAVVIDVTCAEYQIGTLQQDLVEKLFPSLNSACHEQHMHHHSMVGPSRMLFTIKEETKEELEGLDTEVVKVVAGRNNSKRSSRSKSMGDIPLCPLSSAAAVCPSPGSPFITPLSSPDLFSSPSGTPTRNFPLSSSHALFNSGSPVGYKTSCMYDYPKPTSGTVPPPLAPPSPTRPTFSFLASRNVPVSYKVSSASGNLAKGPFPVLTANAAAAASTQPVSSSSGRKSLLQHLTSSSPVHRQFAPSPLRTCSYENDEDNEDDCSTPSFSPRSFSSDRSPCFFSTPTYSFDPVTVAGPAGILVTPSSKGSIFNRRLYDNTFSPLSSPSDCDSTYASPLLVIPSRPNVEEGSLVEWAICLSRRWLPPLVLCWWKLGTY